MQTFKYSLMAISLMTIIGCKDTTSPDVQLKVDNSQASAEDFDVLKHRVIPDFVASSEAAAAKQGSSLAVLANDYAASLTELGAWADINYRQIDPPGWQPSLHLDRLVIIAAQYNKTPTPELGKAVSEALSYWLEANPKSWNWWWHDIGIPKRIGYSAVMAKDALDNSLLERIAQYLPDTPNYSPNNPNSLIPKAANRTDIALAVLNRGLLTGDAQMVGKAISDIEETISIGTVEGIQHDYSFHQHGPQLYTSGYGPVWFGAAAKWASFVDGLPWQFSPEKTDVLVSYMMDGQRWSKRHGQWDYNTMSRGISRVKSTEYLPINTDSLPENTPMDLVAKWAPERAQEAENFKRHEYGNSGSGLNGFKHFWRSDYSVKSADSHLFSIGMNSQRVEPAEAGNGENLKGFWLGFGSTFLLQRGNEYHNIFPVWDWSLVPGVTAPEYVGQPADWGRIMQPDVSFVGGVSNGKYGVTTMDMDIEIRHSEVAHSTQPNFYQLGEGKGRTTAKKSWFSFSKEIVALGAGINSTNYENVNTTLNQVLLNGEVVVDGQIIEQGQRVLNNSRWVHHDNVGYVFPTNWNGKLSNQAQIGSWKSIRTTNAPETISKDVFTLSINHGIEPVDQSYQYILLPGSNAEEVSAYTSDIPVAVISNTEQLQAVRHKELNVTGIVFHKAGEIALADGMVVKANLPSVVLIDESGEAPILSVSTPGQSYAPLELTLLSSKYGDVTHSVLTPGSKAETGKTITFTWNEKVDNSLLNAALAKEQKELADQTEFQLPAEADSEIQDGRYADENFDIVSRWDLYVGQIADKESQDVNATKTSKSLIKFNLARLTETPVKKAILKLHVRDVKGTGEQIINVLKLDNSQWHESQVTWNDVDGIALPINQSLTISDKDTKQWVELDLTELVDSSRKQGALSLILESAGDGYVSFGSDETEQIPMLDIVR
ncbi:polysaccharide lyase family 8 super-sandwich domain-containing protein [Vibrio ziniensis]|uniref:Polysaccharide lyase 8 family protein n=1 Tax=Vibrio ziniensis TaxID=2711221 RepID=A0A6G7CIP4_9VIBR|nr:polysaccharide lyase family 8 super-sandwich domain-containing protein [Vibrio ziniensis]QIH42011.1 polysaccharide lyase 8 family protein [Vibrio ziniensis]